MKALLKVGVPVALAIKLYAEDVLSLGKAATFAGCSVAEFTEQLSKAGIPSVRYSAEELAEELTVIG